MTGWRSIRAGLARVAGLTFYRRLLFLRRVLEPGPAAVPGLEVAWLPDEGIGEYAQLRPDTPLSELERRIGAGQRCLLARFEGRIIGTRWVSVGWAEIAYLERRLELAPGVAYIYDVYSAPQSRRLGLAAATQAPGHRLLSELGIETGLVSVLPENGGGYRLARAGGYEPLGIARCWRGPGFRRLSLDVSEPLIGGGSERLRLGYRLPRLS